MKRQSLTLLILINICALIFSYYVSGSEALKNQIENLGLFAPIIALLVLFIVSLAPFVSSDPLSIFFASIFGFWTSFIMIWLVQFSTTIISYLLIKNTAVEISKEQMFRDKISRIKWLSWFNKVPVNSTVFLICARWLPISVGGDIVRILAGIYQVPIKRLIWCTAISVLLPALEFAALGSGIHLFRNIL